MKKPVLPPIYFLFLALAVLAGCSHKDAESGERSEAYTAALASLNNHEYERAIAILEPMAQANPQDAKLNKRLMHAYAGASGFELGRFKSIMESLAATKFNEDFQGTLDDFKRANSVQKLKWNDIRRFRFERFQSRFQQLFAPVPELDKNQYNRLNQAITLYERQGLDPSSVPAEDNFQWGLIYSYRTLVNVRALGRKIDFVMQGKEKADNLVLEGRILRSIKRILQDVLKAHRLFRNSYGKLQEVSVKIEEFAHRISGKRIKAEVVQTSRTFEDLLNSLLRENVNESSDLMASLVNRVRLGDYEEGLNFYLYELHGSTEESRYKANRMRATMRVYASGLQRKYYRKRDPMRNLFNPALKARLLETERNAVDSESLEPFHALYKDRSSSFHDLLEMAQSIADDSIDGRNRVPENFQHYFRPIEFRTDLVQFYLARDEIAAIEKGEKEATAEELEIRKADLEYTKKRIREHGGSTVRVLRDELEEKPAHPDIDEKAGTP
ncbi:MAG TPA: hypothetical protein VIH99_05955 [Bdellovibrionota bacterium]|jgi:hypothetical protein